MRRALASAALLALSSCGAGLVGGLVASDGGSSTQATPSLSVAPLLPLVPAPDTVRSVVLTNVQVTGEPGLEVRLETADGVVAVQRNPTAISQVGSTQISFVVDTAPIVAAIGDPTAADVPVQLSVWLRGKQLALPTSLLLARQPSVRLRLAADQSERFLAPTGERVDFVVDGLRGAAADLQVLVTTPDPAGGVGPDGARASITRFGTNPSLAVEGGVEVLSVTLPGSPFPTAATIVVRDAVAGQSTTVRNAYYRPDIALALPGQGSGTGGSLLTLIGTALVPYDFAGTGPAPFDFGRVHLSFAKGGRLVELASADFRTDESDSDRLVFTMPPSPDARPGQVDIVLEVELGAATARVVASQKFLYANPDPYFGPRGVVLERMPVAFAPIPIDNAPSTDGVPDFVTLTDRGGVGYLQLFVAQQNGMFQPFGAPRQIGDPEVAAERHPRALCVGDFTGDLVPDVLVVNDGEGEDGAVHQLVVGQKKPLPPLGPMSRFSADFGARIARVGDFNGDGRSDVLLVPGPASPQSLPQVWLADPLPDGTPRFAPPIPLDVRPFAYEAVEVADLDGDGQPDIALVSGTQLELDVVFGLGDGNFGVGVPTSFSVPDYQPDPGSPAVGLHACADGPQQSLCLVLAGLGVAPPTQPAVAVLRQSMPRQYAAPNLSFVSPTPPIGVSQVANVDQIGPIELVVTLAGDPPAPFGTFALLRQFGDVFLPIVLPETGAESPRNVRAMAFDRAFPAGGPSGEALAVFIVHDVAVDGANEKRLSTRLVQPVETQLVLPADGGAQIKFELRNIVAGNFHEISVAGAGAVRDFAVVRADSGFDEVHLISNDGFGGFPSLTDYIEVPGILPDSLTSLPSPTGAIDGLLCCDRSSRLTWWVHDLVPPGVSDGNPDPVLPQIADAVTVELRSLLPPPYDATDLDDQSRMAVADVDGDGVLDLVVMLSFAVTSPGPGDTRVCLLRGIPSPSPGQFPFELPQVMTSVHGNATSIALGDFAIEPAGQPTRLELAIAIPVGTLPGAADGDHVRFFRYAPGATPATDRFVASWVPDAAEVLLVGGAPTRLQAADLDRDGLVDLLAACSEDNTLRLMRNTQGLPLAGGQVDVEAFVESFASPTPLDVGEPTRLRLADVNGDGNFDAVVFVEFVDGGGVRSTTVSIYLGLGDGGFDGPRFASSSRVGNRDSTLSGELGDWNRDGVVDLFLAWATTGTGDVNLRVLFGGTR